MSTLRAPPTLRPVRLRRATDIPASFVCQTTNPAIKALDRHPRQYCRRANVEL
jgi:hypothetical protein